MVINGEQSESRERASERPSLALASPVAFCSHVTSRDYPKWRAFSRAKVDCWKACCMGLNKRILNVTVIRIPTTQKVSVISLFTNFGQSFTLKIFPWVCSQCQFSWLSRSTWVCIETVSFFFFYCMIHYPKLNLHLKRPTDSFGNQMLNDGHKRKLLKRRFQVLLLHIRFDTFLITHYEIEKTLSHLFNLL